MPETDGGPLMRLLGMAAVVLAMQGSALAADLPLKAVKAPPASYDPWDMAF